MFSRSHLHLTNMLPKETKLNAKQTIFVIVSTMVLIGSVSVYGLRNAKKASKMFSHGSNRKKKYDCVLLQETHCKGTEESEQWAKEWSGYNTWYNGTRLSKGVAILISEQAPIKVIHSNGLYLLDYIPEDRNK